MNLTIIGAGYVGLVSAAGFAEMGNNVVCLEADEDKVRLLQSGTVPIHEPGLEPLLQSNVQANRLAFTSSLARAVEHSEIFFIAVGTPPSSDGSTDMSHIHRVATDLGRVMERQSILVTKSTVPIGTTDRVRSIVQSELVQRRVTIDFDCVSNPEFLKEGAAVKDFMNPERIILGCESERSETVLRRLYAPFSRKRDRILVMRPREAEMTKYASNALLATKISFMNEIAEFCADLDVDVERVRAGMGADSRIGLSFLYAGCGYGGSCFPKDIKALIHTAEQIDADPWILRAVERRNERQKRLLYDKVVARFGHDLRTRTIAVWGLSFKPDTDDVREASSLTTIELLLEAGAVVRAHDPVAIENARKLISAKGLSSRRLSFHADQYETLNGAHSLLLLTEWKHFRTPDFDLVKRRLQMPIIFDGRNQYDVNDMAAMGFDYYGVGRGAHIAHRITPVASKL